MIYHIAVMKEVTKIHEEISNNLKERMISYEKIIKKYGDFIINSIIAWV